MQSTTYKLDEYKITENEHGDLWWETHIGLLIININFQSYEPAGDTTKWKTSNL
jgi:hypothetical protein